MSSLKTSPVWLECLWSSGCSRGCWEQQDGLCHLQILEQAGAFPGWSSPAETRESHQSWLGRNWWCRPRRAGGLAQKGRGNPAADPQQRGRFEMYREVKALSYCSEEESHQTWAPHEGMAANALTSDQPVPPQYMKPFLRVLASAAGSDTCKAPTHMAPGDWWTSIWEDDWVSRHTDPAPNRINQVINSTWPYSNKRTDNAMNDDAHHLRAQIWQQGTKA